MFCPVTNGLVSRNSSLIRLTRFAFVMCLAVLPLLGCSESPPQADSRDADFEVEIASRDMTAPRLTDVTAQQISFREANQFRSASARVKTRENRQRIASGMTKREWALKQLQHGMRPPTTSLKPQHKTLVSDTTPETETAETPVIAPSTESLPTSDAAKQLVLKPADDDEVKDADLPKELRPDTYKDWEVPDVALFVSGQQNGYIEPCGCTGLDKQKGGIARRATFMNQLKEAGWDLVPVDSGNQIRRLGQQAAIKLSWSTEALNKMNYQLVGFGPADMRLAATDLLSVAIADDPEQAMYVSANVVLIDKEFMPTSKVITRGKHKIGLTSILDPNAMEGPVSAEITIDDPAATAKTALKEMDAKGATFKVLSYFGKEEAGMELAQKVPGYDLIIVGGGYGEPTYKPTDIENSSTKMIVPGNKGMYAGLVGLYDGKPFKYARVPLTHEFTDDAGMRKIMAEYQQQLEALGLNALGLRPAVHPSGNTYIGSEACKKCHEEAYDIWEGSPHFDATASIVSPPEDRGDVARHFDPECLSCHVTGWNPQDYSPYATGYLDLKGSKHLHGNGCENCHGPGAEHSAAEKDGSAVSEAKKLALRKAMDLPFEKAKEHCQKCHDLDNSPDFYETDAFEDEYWPTIEH